MKQIKDIPAFLIYEGILMEVVGYYQGQKILIMQPVQQKDFPKCPNCNHTLPRHYGEIPISEECRNFQEGAQPVITVEGAA